MSRKPAEERFWAKVNKGGPGGCWLWTACIAAGNGYGLFSYGGRNVLAHRFAYKLLVGPIPPGKTIDHICRVRRCVRPEHLRPMTHRKNILIGVAPPAMNARKVACKRGHGFTPENTRICPDGSRECRACTRERARTPKYKAMNRERLRRRRARGRAQAA